jgi:excisionase family DNA binding protein
MPRGYSEWRHNWTREEERRLGDLMCEYHSYAEIAAELGRSVWAIRLRAKRVLGLALSKAGGHTVNVTARLLGVDSHVVKRWCDRGWLKWHDIGMQVYSGRVRLVGHDELLDFLEDEGHWHLYEPGKITDSGMREWAIEMRAGVRFLTTGQVGKRLGLSDAAVNDHIHRGSLRAVKRGSNWLVRECDVRYPEPRTTKGQRRPPPFSEAEHAKVRHWWGRYPATEIAQRLGRGNGSIYRVAARLGLPALGKGHWQKRQCLGQAS